MTGVPWGVRLFWVIAAAFFLPSVALGTVSPVMAKLAIDRVRRTKRTGRAIGVVYAWGMVGSILGTFLTGFLLIDVLGTKGVLLAMATTPGAGRHGDRHDLARRLGGDPAGPLHHHVRADDLAPDPGRKLGHPRAGRRPEPPTEDDAIAWLDESNYYYIKVENSIDAEGTRSGPWCSTT